MFQRMPVYIDVTLPTFFAFINCDSPQSQLTWLHTFGRQGEKNTTKTGSKEQDKCEEFTCNKKKGKGEEERGEERGECPSAAVSLSKVRDCGQAGCMSNVKLLIRHVAGRSARENIVF